MNQLRLLLFISGLPFWAYRHATKFEENKQELSSLATIDMGRKFRGRVPFSGAGPHLTQCRLGRGLLPYQIAS